MMSEFSPPKTHILKDLWKALAPLSFFPWFFKKKWQSFARTHLSFYLALLLVPFAIVHEWDNLHGLKEAILHGRWPHGDQWLVLIAVLGVLYTCKLELFDKQHAVSSQETLFHIGVRLAMKEFESLAATTASREEIEKGFDRFVALLLQIASQTFSLGGRVDAGLMVKVPGQETLKLVKWSNQAKYDAQLEVPIPAGGDSSKTGPAGIAFAKNCLVYVPRKGRTKPKRVWPFQQDEKNPHSFAPQEAHRCWISAKSPELEKFRSVISAPVGGLGVLNLSTRRRDPFIYRDFLMAQYFARILWEASLLRQQNLTTINLQTRAS